MCVFFDVIIDLNIVRAPFRPRGARDSGFRNDLSKEYNIGFSPTPSGPPAYPSADPPDVYAETISRVKHSSARGVARGSHDERVAGRVFNKFRTE